jgi:predicted site-specific integrase-resolvase
METASEQEQYVTMADWTQQLGVSIQTGHRWVREGKFIRWKKSVVAAWIESRQSSK